MGPGLLATVKSQADRTAQWAAIALGVSIPLSTALDNVLLVLVAAGWLASCAWRETWQATRANTVALAALGLFALLALGTLYGERNPGDATTYLGKYVDLLFVPVFAFIFRDAALRQRATYALAASLALVLAISFLIVAGMPVAKPLLGSPGNPVVFKQYLTHGILLAYGFVGPLSGVIEQKVDESTKELQCVKVTLLASLNGYAPPLALEEEEEAQPPRPVQAQHIPRAVVFSPRLVQRLEEALTHLEVGLDPVLVLQPELRDFELQLADRAEDDVVVGQRPVDLRRALFT